MTLRREGDDWYEKKKVLLVGCSTNRVCLWQIGFTNDIFLKKGPAESAGLVKKNKEKASCMTIREIHGTEGHPRGRDTRDT